MFFLFLLNVISKSSIILQWGLYILGMCVCVFFLQKNNQFRWNSWSLVKINWLKYAHGVLPTSTQMDNNQHIFLDQSFYVFCVIRLVHSYIKRPAMNASIIIETIIFINPEMVLLLMHGSQWQKHSTKCVNSL